MEEKVIENSESGEVDTNVDSGKDEMYSITCRKVVLAMINESRKERGLKPLLLDEKLSASAKAHAEDLAKHDADNHFSSNGDDLQTRVFRYGFFNIVHENIHAAVVDSLQNTEEELNKIWDDIHVKFVTEEAPNNDNASNMLSPSASVVGIGMALVGNRFRYVEVYGEETKSTILTESMDLIVSNDVVETKDSEEETEGTIINISGSVVSPAEHGPYAVAVYEKENSNEEAILDIQKESPIFISMPWDISFDKMNGNFTTPLNLGRIKENYSYYVYVFLKLEPNSIPYTKAVEDCTFPNSEAIVSNVWILNVPQIESFPIYSLTNKGIIARVNEAPQANYNLEENQAYIYGKENIDNEIVEQTLPIQDIKIIFESNENLLKENENMIKDEKKLWENGEIFIPIDRKERVTTINTGLWFSRILESDLENKDAHNVIEDIMFVDGGKEEEMVIPEGYELVGSEEGADPLNLASVVYTSNDNGLEADLSVLPKDYVCYLCVKKAPLSTLEANNNSEIIDIALIYTQSENFNLGWGFTTISFPPKICQAFKVSIALSYKRKGDSVTFLTSDENQKAIPNLVEDESSLIEKSLTSEELAQMNQEKLEEELRFQEEEAIKEAEEAKRQEIEELKKLLQKREQHRCDLLNSQLETHRKLASLFALQKSRDTNHVGSVLGGPGNSAENGKGDMKENNSAEKDLVSAAESERQYADTLNAILDLRMKMRRQMKESDNLVSNLQAKLDDREFKANQITKSFLDFKHEIIVEAENSRTGNKIPEKIIEEFEELERKKAEEMEKTRLKNITLRITHKKLEQKLKLKEQLAEGLHLIDFEQLKIENQTLSEKVEERNEELAKLRKKNIITVQVLTHLKEKLKFVEHDNESTTSKLSKLELEVSSNREKLRRLKRDKDSLKSSNLTLKHKQGLSSNELLIMDYENRKHEIQDLKKKVKELQDQHRLYENQISSMKRATMFGISASKFGYKSDNFHPSSTVSSKDSQVHLPPISK